jgi:hypothetical protein
MFLKISYQLGRGTGSKADFWLVWNRYIPSFESGIKLVQNWYYLRIPTQTFTYRKELHKIFLSRWRWKIRRGTSQIIQTYEINNYMNKRINTRQGNKRRKKKERTQVQTKDHTPKCKMHNGEPIPYVILYYVDILRCYPFECRAYNSMG